MGYDLRHSEIVWLNFHEIDHVSTENESDHYSTARKPKDISHLFINWYALCITRMSILLHDNKVINFNLKYGYLKRRDKRETSLLLVASFSLFSYSVADCTGMVHANVASRVQWIKLSDFAL